MGYISIAKFLGRFPKYVGNRRENICEGLIKYQKTNSLKSFPYAHFRALEFEILIINIQLKNHFYFLRLQLHSIPDSSIINQFHNSLWMICWIKWRKRGKRKPIENNLHALPIPFTIHPRPRGKHVKQSKCAKFSFWLSLWIFRVVW